MLENWISNSMFNYYSRILSNLDGLTGHFMKHYTKLPSKEMSAEPMIRSW